MKYLLLLLCFCIYTEILAQEEEEEMYIEEAEMPMFQYTDVDKAISNVLSVQILDLKKNQADRFLTEPFNFPNIKDLVIHFAKVKEIKDLKNTNLSSIRIIYSWQLQTLPNNFDQYKELKKLELYNNSITELPSSIFNNSSITSMCLCNNEIVDFSKISKNNTLNKLDLSLNPLTTLPADFSNLKNLEVLTLKHSKLEEFPKVLLNLNKLQVLDLGLNPIKILPKELGKMQQLQWLYIPGTDIKKLPTSFKNSNLKYVMIDGKKLSGKEKQKLKSSLPKDCKIQWTDSVDYQVDLSFGCMMKDARF